MGNNWTETERIDILRQLDAKQLPFAAETMIRSSQMHLLGEGGFGYVYDCYRRKNAKNSGVVKVVGFQETVNYADIQREVSIQKKLARKSKNVVKIYDFTCLHVWVDDNNCVVKAETVNSNENLEQKTGNCITLAFIRMEKLRPIINRDKERNVRCINGALTAQSFDEVTKLFYDIASALEVAHRKKILHGDIKLENIYYDSKKNIYKLGDFGTAVQTEYGVAQYIASSSGFVAPEVYNCKIKKYDATADIYSLGMVIFVLRNGMKKAGSDSYRANVAYQYQEDYILDRPENDYGDDDRLYKLIRKMCSYLPSERPQKMRYVIGDLSGIMVRHIYGWQVKYPWVYIALGVLLIIRGATSGFFLDRQWISDNTILGVVAFIKAASLLMRNRKAHKMLYIAKKIDLIYLASMIVVLAYDIVGACILLVDVIPGSLYYYVDAPKALCRLLIIEFLAFYGVDKSNFWRKMERLPEEL
jgi:hypothetical protein